MLAQLKERDPEMRKLAARVAARRAKESAKARGAAPMREPAFAGGAHAYRAPDLDSEGYDDEPTNEELAASQANSGRPAGSTRITLTPSSAPVPSVKPLADGGAKRPQPQHLPRSQRKRP
jgi:preprotein translocase subunit SecF